jgi:hypothetical protein
MPTRALTATASTMMSRERGWGTRNGRPGSGRRRFRPRFPAGHPRGTGPPGRQLLGDEGGRGQATDGDADGEIEPLADEVDQAKGGIRPVSRVADAVGGRGYVWWSRHGQDSDEPRRVAGPGGAVEGQRADRQRSFAAETGINAGTLQFWQYKLRQTAWPRLWCQLHGYAVTRPRLVLVLRVLMSPPAFEESPRTASRRS